MKKYDNVKFIYDSLEYVILSQPDGYVMSQAGWVGISIWTEDEIDQCFKDGKWIKVGGTND